MELSCKNDLLAAVRVRWQEAGTLSESHVLVCRCCKYSARSSGSSNDFPPTKPVDQKGLRIAI